MGIAYTPKYKQVVDLDKRQQKYVKKRQINKQTQTNINKQANKQK